MKRFIPSRFAPLLYGAILSTIMVSVVSIAVLLVNQGLTEDFAVRWLKSFLTAWPVAFPTVLVVAPTVRKWVNYLIA